MCLSRWHSHQEGDSSSRGSISNILGLGVGMKIELYLPRAKENNNLDSQGENTWCHCAKTLLWLSLAAPLGLGHSEHGGESGN